MKAFLLTLACLAPGAPGASAQEPAATPPLPAAEEPGWLFALSLYGYFVPEDDDYLQPTLSADRGPLHLEVRYNYEDLRTASVWAGWNLDRSGEIALALTPMAGVAFGETNGVALGYHAALDWWKLELYSEGEYLHDLDDSSDSYFFSWSELTIAPFDWLRAGLVAQRTRVYQSELDIQRGFLVGLVGDPVSVTINCFNPDQDDPIWLLALEVQF